MRAGTRTVGWRAEADGTPGWAPEMTTGAFRGPGGSSVIRGLVLESERPGFKS